MSLRTISDLGRISREELARQIRAGADNIAVVDVRDNDYIGGHIVGGQHVPLPALDYKLPEMVRELKDKDVVVFHCALSQQRGPKGALQYLRERDRMLGQGFVGERKDGAKLDDKQQVAVLEGGFVKWQEKYGKDQTLTEDYRKELWEED